MALFIKCSPFGCLIGTREPHTEAPRWLAGRMPGINFVQVRAIAPLGNEGITENHDAHIRNRLLESGRRCRRFRRIPQRGSSMPAGTGTNATAQQGNCRRSARADLDRCPDADMDRALFQLGYRPEMAAVTMVRPGPALESLALARLGP